MSYRFFVFTLKSSHTENQVWTHICKSAKKKCQRHKIILEVFDEVRKSLNWTVLLGFAFYASQYRLKMALRPVELCQFFKQHSNKTNKYLYFAKCFTASWTFSYGFLAFVFAVTHHMKKALSKLILRCFKSSPNVNNSKAKNVFSLYSYIFSADGNTTMKSFKAQIVGDRA